MSAPSIKRSVSAYESWMRAQLGDDLVAADVKTKREKMAQSPFVFLRATYWRWAETVYEVLPELAAAPPVLAVGDIHVENFGTWRDEEGRLVWGVNDFDETFEMPYALDLVRLAASVLLAEQRETGARSTCATILEGYTAGLEQPRPVVLERDWQWLRSAVVISEPARAKFWKKMRAAIDSPWREDAPKRFRSALAEAMPAKIEFVTTRRTAGAGSLGRPRWVGYAEWNGAPVVREAKALLPSAWTLARGIKHAPLRCAEAAKGPFRSPDPWYTIKDKLVVRRLSPNNRKLDAVREIESLLTRDMLYAMGHEIANIHATGRTVARAVLRDLSARPADWLPDCAKRAARATEADFRAWKGV